MKPTTEYYEIPIVAGESYVVKPWKLMESQYGLNSFGSIDIKHAFTKKMEELLPSNRVIEIERIPGPKNFGRWQNCSIIPEMLLGPAFEWGEEIEVSDYAVEWCKLYFWGYAPDKDGRWAINGSWHYGRRIQKPQIKLTVKINGEDVDPSAISEETWNNLRKGLAQ